MLPQINPELLDGTTSVIPVQSSPEPTQLTINPLPEYNAPKIPSLTSSETRAGSEWDKWLSNENRSWKKDPGKQLAIDILPEKLSSAEAEQAARYTDSGFSYLRGRDNEAYAAAQQGFWTRTLNDTKVTGVNALGSFAAGFFAIPQLLKASADIIQGKSADQVFETLQGEEGSMLRGINRGMDEYNQSHTNFQSGWAAQNPWKNLIPFYGGEGGSDFGSLARSAGYLIGGVGQSMVESLVLEAASAGIATPVVGMSIASKIGKAVKGLETLGDALNLINKTAKQVQYMDDAVRGAQVLRNAGRIFSNIDTPIGPLGIRTVAHGFLSSNAEASMEGYSAEQELTRTLIDKYRQENSDQDPDYDTLKQIREAAKKAGNASYMLNQILLGVSNNFQMSNLLKNFPGAKRIWGESEDALQLINRKGKYEVGKPELTYKYGNNEKWFEKAFTRAGRTGEWLGKSTLANGSEALEESMQGAISTGTQQYYQLAYANNGKTDSISMLDAGLKGLEHAFGTREGWTEFLGGLVISTLGGQGIKKLTDVFNEPRIRKALEQQAAWMNVSPEALANAISYQSKRGTVGLSLEDKQKNVQAILQASGVQNEAAWNGDQWVHQNMKNTGQFLYLIPWVKTGSGDALKEQFDSWSKDIRENRKEFVEQFGLQELTNEELENLPREYEKQLRMLEDIHKNYSILMKNPFDFKTDPQNYVLWNEYYDHLLYNEFLRQSYGKRINSLTGDIGKITTPDTIKPFLSIEGLDQLIAKHQKELSDLQKNINATDQLLLDSEEKPVKEENETSDTFQSRLNGYNGRLETFRKNERERLEKETKQQREHAQKVIDALEKLKANDFEVLDDVVDTFREIINDPAGEYKLNLSTNDLKSLMQRGYDLERLKESEKNVQSILDGLNRKDGFDAYVKTTTQYKLRVAEHEKKIKELVQKQLQEAKAESKKQFFNRFTQTYNEAFKEHPNVINAFSVSTDKRSEFWKRWFDMYEALLNADKTADKAFSEVEQEFLQWLQEKDANGLTNKQLIIQRVDHQIDQIDQIMQLLEKEYKIDPKDKGKINSVLLKWIQSTKKNPLELLTSDKNAILKDIEKEGVVLTKIVITQPVAKQSTSQTQVQKNTGTVPQTTTPAATQPVNGIVFGVNHTSNTLPVYEGTRFTPEQYAHYNRVITAFNEKGTPSVADLKQFTDDVITEIAGVLNAGKEEIEKRFVFFKNQLDDNTRSIEEAYTMALANTLAQLNVLKQSEQIILQLSKTKNIPSNLVKDKYDQILKNNSSKESIAKNPDLKNNKKKTEISLQQLKDFYAGIGSAQTPVTAADQQPPVIPPVTETKTDLPSKKFYPVNVGELLTSANLFVRDNNGTLQPASKATLESSPELIAAHYRRMQRLSEMMLTKPLSELGEWTKIQGVRNADGTLANVQIGQTMYRTAVADYYIFTVKDDSLPSIVFPVNDTFQIDFSQIPDDVKELTKTKDHNSRLPLGVVITLPEGQRLFDELQQRGLINVTGTYTDIREKYRQLDELKALMLTQRPDVVLNDLSFSLVKNQMVNRANKKFPLRELPFAVMKGFTKPLVIKVDAKGDLKSITFSDTLYTEGERIKIRKMLPAIRKEFAAQKIEDTADGEYLIVQKNDTNDYNIIGIHAQIGNEEFTQILRTKDEDAIDAIYKDYFVSIDYAIQPDIIKRSFIEFSGGYETKNNQKKYKGVKVKITLDDGQIYYSEKSFVLGSKVDTSTNQLSKILQGEFRNSEGKIATFFTADQANAAQIGKKSMSLADKYVKLEKPYMYENVKWKWSFAKKTDDPVQGKQDESVSVNVSDPVVIDTVSDTEYQDFLDNGIVPEDTLKRIAQKVKNSEQLTPKENEIFLDKTNLINELIAEEFNQEQKDDGTREAEELLSTVPDITDNSMNPLTEILQKLGIQDTKVGEYLLKNSQYWSQATGEMKHLDLDLLEKMNPKMVEKLKQKPDANPETDFQLLKNIQNLYAASPSRSLQLAPTTRLLQSKQQIKEEAKRLMEICE